MTAAPEVSDDDFAQILRQTREFVRTEVVPRELQIMAEDEIPSQIRAKAAAMGLFGYALPQEYGGLGLDMAQDVEMAMEFGYTSLAFRSMLGTNNGIAGQVLVGYGTEEQRAQWLGRIASGEAVAAFALTEDGAGSNPAGLRTRAEQVGDDWVIARTQALHHQRSDRRRVRGLRAHPRTRRDRARDRGVPGAARRTGCRGRAQGPQDGDGGRLDR